MPIAGLTLRFNGREQVRVAFDGADSGPQPFTIPLTPKDRQDIAWYIETYGAHSLADPDDAEARRIAGRLAEIGRALFAAVFAAPETQAAYADFQRVQDRRRVLTVEAADAGIHSLPWELLRDPQGTFLFRATSPVSLRRRLCDITSEPAPRQAKPKDRLHLLFVVSRPSGAGFIDPRADPAAVLDAIAEQAPGRVTCELLRPASLDALTARLDDSTKPPVDILHFDGHGVFWQRSREQVEQARWSFGPRVLDELERVQSTTARAQGEPVGIGFLLFERRGAPHLLCAADIAGHLARAGVRLVVLSACESAKLDEAVADPLASVAGRLAAEGIDAVLAMTHSVLVATTRKLFGAFYAGLAAGESIATALDRSRQCLADDPEKGMVRRGDTWQALNVHDWFLPALFQVGRDAPLLTAVPEQPLPSMALLRSNLPPPRPAGFFGRAWELWEIDYRLLVAGTRRVTITGFGGQGKTELAQEAGRWLTHPGLAAQGPFRAAVFVDYAQPQGEPVAVAVATIAEVLSESLTDADAATAALTATPTLLILDNLEALPADDLCALLDAAVPWSEAGGSRLLLTTRGQDLGHSAYAGEVIRLQGLGSRDYPNDTLDWYAALTRLPPAPSIDPPGRDALVDLFDRVDFHPLSIAVLAQQLKDRTPDELGERLAALLAEPVADGVVRDGVPRSLIASVDMSLERLSPAERLAVRRLGVFEGGAMEDHLLAITGLGDPDDQTAQLAPLLAALDVGDPGPLLAALGQPVPNGTAPPDLLAQLQANPDFQALVADLRARLAAPADRPWPALRARLETAALIAPEAIPNVGPAYLRFHPTLAPLLWAQLDADEQTRLAEAHRRRYSALARDLYQADFNNPHEARAIARRELPNLRAALDRALAAGDGEAVDFANSVNRFLGYFGLGREAAALTERAGRLRGARGSQTWIVAESNRGEQLLAQGRADAAAAVFADILAALAEIGGGSPSYERAVTLGLLGRCEAARGRPDRAEAHYRAGIAETEGLEQTDGVKRHRAALHPDLADALMLQGRYAEARVAYEKSLAIQQEIGGDARGEGVVLAQLGTLALQEGDLAEAVRRYEAALDLFRRLGEPGSEAVVQNQLGRAFEEAGQWGPAEQHYREAARLFEQLGDLAHAAQTWNNLAVVNERLGKPEAAETWYRKAIDGLRKAGDLANVSKGLYNLADLLQHLPDRLNEARQLAKEALAIKQTLDPGAAQIWTTCDILAQIADRQSRPAEAKGYRRQAREAKRAFAGTAQQLGQFAPLIQAIAAAVNGPPEARASLEQEMAQLDAQGGEAAAFAAALTRILDGERDPETLCAGLGADLSLIIETTLTALTDPTQLPDDG